MEIKMGDSFATILGFTRDLFLPGSYLWLDGKRIVVSFVATASPGKGHFRRLVERILEMGYDVAIPIPIGRMRDIVSCNGYEHAEELDPEMGLVDVWTLKVERNESGSRPAE